MPAICITGMDQDNLDLVEGILQKAGMSSSLPATRNPDFDIKSLHAQIVKNAQSDHETFSRTQTVSLLCQQLASDIFLSNLKQNVWGWADERSFSFLEFWASFDYDLFFIIVLTSPERYVFKHFTEDLSEETIIALLTKWELAQQQILNAYRKLPARILLFDFDDILAHQDFFLQQCSSRLGIDLSSSSISPISRQQDDADYIGLVRNIIAIYPPAEAVYNKILGVTIKYDETRHVEPSTGSLYRPIVSAINTIKSLQSVISDLNSKLHLAPQAPPSREPLPVPQDTQIRKQSLLADRLKRIVKENKYILNQLHDAQENAEKLLAKNAGLQNKLKAFEKRWTRMLQKFPYAYDFDSIDIKQSATESPLRMSFLMKGLKLASTFYGSLAFDINFSNDASEIRFDISDDNSVVLLLPSSLLQCYEYQSFSETFASSFDRSKPHLYSLTSTNFDLLRIALSIIHEQAEPLSRIEFPSDNARSVFAQSIVHLASALDTLPSVFRFDKATVVRSVVNPTYEHLWFTLDNARCLREKYKTFEFRLSCAEITENAFGKYPKLEFPEGNAMLDSWFSESSDDFGPKLEIRFALPDAFDLDVFTTLSDHDKTIVASLSFQLPHIIAQIQQSKFQIQRDWNDWLTVAYGIQDILLTQGYDFNINI